MTKSVWCFLFLSLFYNFTLAADPIKTLEAKLKSAYPDLDFQIQQRGRQIIVNVFDKETMLEVDRLVLNDDAKFFKIITRRYPNIKLEEPVVGQVNAEEFFPDVRRGAQMVIDYLNRRGIKAGYTLDLRDGDLQFYVNEKDGLNKIKKLPMGEHLRMELLMEWAKDRAKLSIKYIELQEAIEQAKQIPEPTLLENARKVLRRSLEMLNKKQKFIEFTKPKSIELRGRP